MRCLEHRKIHVHVIFLLKYSKLSHQNSVTDFESVTLFFMRNNRLWIREVTILLPNTNGVRSPNISKVSSILTHNDMLKTIW